MMINMKCMLVACLIFAGLGGWAECQSLFVTKEQCVESVKSIETVSDYLDFAKRLMSENNGGMSEQQWKIINRCLHSVHGLKDVTTLQRVVELAATVHSVCEPEFTEKLLQVDRRLKQHTSRGKVLGLKQRHRLSKFFRIFAGQVVLTCKKSLKQKLHFAEEQNNELSEALERIVGLSGKSPHDRLDSIKTLPTVLQKLISLAVKHTPTIFTKVENIILFESLKPDSDAVFSMGITLNTKDMLNEFTKTKRACLLIDEYAQSSMYAIARLAWRGYLARDHLDTIDESLIHDDRVQKWIKAVQYCQGVLIVKANLDLEQESSLKFVDQQNSLNDDHILTVDLDRRALPIGQDELSAGKVFQYQESDTFSTFDSDLECITYSSGITGWLTKRLGMGERLLARYIKVSVLDESYKRSMLNDVQQDNSEGEVQFVGTGGSQAFSHVANHAVVGTSVGDHLHYLGGSSGAEAGIVAALCFVGVFLLAFILLLIDFAIVRHSSGYNSD